MLGRNLHQKSRTSAVGDAWYSLLCTSRLRRDCASRAYTPRWAGGSVRLHDLPRGSCSRSSAHSAIFAASGPDRGDGIASPGGDSPPIFFFFSLFTRPPPAQTANS